MSALNKGHYPSAPPTGHHWLRVKKYRKLTDESVQIFFEVPEPLAGLFHFQSGQHLDVVIYNGTDVLRRSYSICSGPGEPLSIAVKRIKGGLVSGFLNTSVREGDYLAVSAPHGSFILNENARHITMFAAGSGITPLLSMLKFAVVRHIRVTLIYGNQTVAATMFRQDLSEFHNVKTVYLLSRENREGYLNGRISEGTLSTLTSSDSSILASDEFYICGPAEMITSVRNFLEKSGCRAEHIHQEFFHAPVTPQSSTPKFPDVHAIPEYSLQLVLEGDKHTIIVKSPDASLLDAALRQGINAPFSCKNGVCGSCRAKVLKGSVVMRANYALTDEEINDNYVLTCQSKPTCSDLSISFDA